MRNEGMRPAFAILKPVYKGIVRGRIGNLIVGAITQTLITLAGDVLDRLAMHGVRRTETKGRVRRGTGAELGGR
jgi:hypothetical protein